MRTAFEKGFNVVTLKDCTAATSEDGQKGAVDGAPRDSLMLSFTVFNARLSRVWCLSKPRSVRVKHKGCLCQPVYRGTDTYYSFT